ncbi:hypothetical protein PJK45_14700 [Mycobacterium kansasii]|uniref:Uncharacterized protein n=3 Tax=Mycobacterium kansasii TaxID=1768 RepID=A0A653F0D4_MYCKA|nr:hypothetical protein [Mycobacterium kansasii]AGZ54099.1 hypothetical protein MKAN_08035 [Mycobacterium kansasii ATCC 12478]ARG57928.1 hypothetical protein B1T43_21080 [Mycobacterium kansasii]ARG63440.1 hypothetical protein B1T45_21585 [Mycobacterium kansasii]ARG71080.1 hypothetical protein B1T47_20885 [Mycobacterium kansasii]ARG77791.1 hypothetical protein B1T51_28740 [Mycobacterium kansasii]
MARLISKCCLALAAVLTVLTSAWTVISVPAAAVPAAPSGEIWQWALGKSMLTDPTLRDYLNSVPGGPGRVCYGDPKLCQQSTPDPQDIRALTDIVRVPNEGFGLVPDEHATVVGVVLYNDIREQKYLYRGKLPEGWTWDSTATDVGAVFGAPNMVAGFEQQPYIPIAFKYQTADHLYDLRVDFAATTADELPGAHMRTIAVSQAPGAPASQTAVSTSSPAPASTSSAPTRPPNA